MATVQYLYAGSGAPAAEVRSGTTRAYQFDGMRSTRQMVDTTGSVTDTFGFDLLGNVRSRTGSTPTPFTWNVGAGKSGSTTGLFFQDRWKPGRGAPVSGWGTGWDTSSGSDYGQGQVTVRNDQSTWEILNEIISRGGFIEFVVVLVVRRNGAAQDMVVSSGARQTVIPGAEQITTRVTVPLERPQPKVVSDSPCYTETVWSEGWNPMGFAYGCYCGSKNVKDPAKKVKPIDCIDACCFMHDRCLEAHYGAGRNEECAHFCCDNMLQKCIDYTVGSRCCDDAPDPVECRQAGWMVSATFWALSVWFGSPDFSIWPRGKCCPPCLSANAWPDFAESKWEKDRI